MKKILYFIICSFVLCSCEKELDITSPSTLTFQGFWDSEDGARAAHAGLYANFRSNAGNFWIMGEVRSDMFGGNTFETPSNVGYIESNISSSVVPFDNWAGLYTYIHRLNDFIANVPNVEFNNPDEQSHMMGQAYGMRAFYYYALLRTWGKVPISTEPQVNIDPANVSKARSPKSEVMQLIKDDLATSLDYFGSDGSYWNNKRIYWSKAATLALKGDVYIWSGNILGGGNADFQEAKNALEQIAALNVALESDFAAVWDYANQENNEFIFSFDYEQDEAYNFYSALTGRGTEIQPQFDQYGNSMGDFTVNGNNRYGPSEKILLALDDPLDSRSTETFIKLYKDDNGGAGYPTYDSDAYAGAMTKKFIGTVVSGSRITTNDVPLYRYADVLLLIAEAKNLLGEDPSTEINAVRARAYGSNYNVTIHGYTNGSQSENTDAILEERFKEFATEGKRWWDLRRAGDTYVFDNNDYISPSESYLLQLPISIDMIGRNPLLEQTEGY
ncbi:RagB/SusD family nutrient uptake outer membrane protein [Allomuricauda sp. M10]|uniref:RagB/SusD family nutrient uptake outer membrane protein n=1 Tax=Allomuricauda sp. M10 TaxID=2683292 RepID=UPI001D197C33|nr:RagB/SusD family nutrient uptake outer membrane protein [Muricauda sp. M10]